MDGKSLRVNLIANTSQFKTAMTESSKQIGLLNSEFKKAANETDQYGNKLDSTAAKKKQLSGVIQQYQTRIKAITNEQKHWTKELEKGNITETQHAQKQQELARRLNNTEAEMKRYEGQLKRINAEGQATTRTYADFDKQFRQVGNTVRDVGTQVGITAGVGFVAMKRILGDVANEAMTLEAGMSKVKAISGATAEEMAAMEAQALELNKTTVFTAEQAAAGQEKLALAGWKANEIMSAMPGMLDLAAAGALDLADAADITSDVMSAFGLSADKAGHAADVFAYAQANANTNVQQAGEAMTYLAPVANALGWELEESAAAIMKLADSGVKGSMAGQAFATSLSRLAKPTTRMTGEMKRLGMEFFDAQGNMKSLPDLMKEIEKGTKGMTKEQKSSTLSILFGAEAYKHWAILLESGSDELARTTEELKNADGAAAKMAETMLDNAQGAIVRMQSAISGLKVEIGNRLLPILTDAANYIGDLASKLGEMDDETLTTIAHTALLVTAVLGVTTGVSALVAGIGAFMMVAGPVGLAIAGGTLLLGGLAAAIYTNQQRTENLRKEQEQAATDAIRYGEGLSEGTKKGVKGYVDLYEGAKVKMLELKSMSGKEAQATNAEIVKAFSEMADAVITELEVQKDKLSRAINEVYAVAGEAGMKAAQDLTQKVLESYDADIAEYKNALDVIKQVQQEFSGDASKLPEDLRISYEEALKVMGDGAREFAQTQKELSIIQQNIVDRQGGILFDEVQGYTKRINETYANSINAALEWSAEQNTIFEDGLAKGKLSQEEFNSVIASTEATTAQMIAESVSAQESSLMALAENLDARGKLIDLATGEEFERLQKGQLNRHGIMLTQEESELEYYERWREHNRQFVEDTVSFSEAALEQQKNALVSALEALGMTREAAVAEAEKLMADTLAELGKGDEEAREFGKKKGDAHKEGLESTKTENEQAGESVAGSVLEYMEKYKDESGQAGKAKGDAHKAGIDSTKSANEKSAKDVSDGANKNLNTNEDGASNAGKKKGDAHKTGLDSTKGANEATSDALSLSVSSILGSTTDGGGGVQAGDLFNRGIFSFKERVNKSGEQVAESGKTGLASVKTTQTGTDFVTGFSGSISAGAASGGSVWTAAWNLGRSALTALKRSIDSHSPSEETKEEGENFTDGFGIAIDDGVKSVTKSAMQMGLSTVASLADGIKDKRQDALNEVNKLLKDIRAQVSEATDAEKDEIKKNNDEIKKIEKRANEDIYLIKQKAKKAKRKLTEAELIKIRRIEEDAAKKTQALRTKNNKVEQDIAKRQNAELIKLAEEYVQDKKSNGEITVTDEIYFWNAMYKATEKGSDLYEMAMKNHQDAVKKLRTEIESTNKEFNDRLLAIDKEYADESQKLHDQVNKTREDEMNKRLNAVGLFEEFSRSWVSGYDLINNLESQVDALKEYGEVIGDLSGRINDESLVEELKGLGIKSLDQLQALNDLSDDELARYVELYQIRFQEAKEQTDEVMKPMINEVDQKLVDLKEQTTERLDEVNREWKKKIQQIVKGADKEFDSMYQVGIDAMHGLDIGMLSKESELMETARRIANNITAEIQRALDINSPSGVMERDVGYWLPEGIAKGAIGNMGVIKKSMNKMSEAFKVKVDDYKIDFGKLAFAVGENNQLLKVEHEFKQTGVEKLLMQLIDVVKNNNDSNQKPVTKNEYNIQTNDNAESIARAIERADRRTAFRMG